MNSIKSIHCWNSSGLKELPKTNFALLTDSGLTNVAKTGYICYGYMYEMLFQAPHQFAFVHFLKFQLDNFPGTSNRVVSIFKGFSVSQACQLWPSGIYLCNLVFIGQSILNIHDYQCCCIPAVEP